MTTTTRRWLGKTPGGETIYAHDGVAEHQTCARCGTTTGASITWPTDCPYADHHPEQFGDAWDGRCPVCGSRRTGLSARYYASARKREEVV